jgi:glutamine amidotransferase
MIAIVDYGIEKHDSLVKLLSDRKIDFRITNSEPGILSSDKVILPNTRNITSAVKKLHLFNLFTMLRVCNKPILGISAGMNLMSAFIKDLSLAGLGIFPGTSESIKIKNENMAETNFSSIYRIKESKLLKNLTGEENFFFDSPYFLPIDDFTTAEIERLRKLSAVMEKSHYFGVQFLPEKSGDAGFQILKSFFEL